MRWLCLILLVGCGKSESKTIATPPSVPPNTKPEKLPFLELADFEYREAMELPENVKAWNGKYVIATGYMNPPGDKTTGLTSFLLVKDAGSCCFGTLPKFNHFIKVTLMQGKTTNFSRDPMSIVGVIEVGEVWDGDWPDSLFRMKDAVVIE